MSNYLGFAPSKSDNYFFISYNNEDASRVGEITTKMATAGASLWYDYGIEYGDTWKTTITEKIKKSSAVILFFTKGILKKSDSFVYKEYEIAKLFEKKIYVVRLDEIANADIPDEKVFWWLEINASQNIIGYEFPTYADLAKEILSVFAVPQDNQYLSDPAESDMDYGDLYMDINPGYAREAYKSAIDIYNGLSEEKRNLFLPNLAKAYQNICLSYITYPSSTKGDIYEKAKVCCQKALEIYEHLSAEDRKLYLPELASLYSNLCTICTQTKDTSDAKIAAQKSIELYEALFKDNNAEYGIPLSKIYRNLADLCSSKNSYKDLINAYSRSIDILEQLISQGEDAYEELIAVFHTFSTYIFREKQIYTLVPVVTRLIDTLEFYCHAYPTVPEDELGQLWWNIGDVYRRLNNMQKANSFFSRALEIYEKLDTDDSGRYSSCISILKSHLGF